MTSQESCFMPGIAAALLWAPLEKKNKKQTNKQTNTALAVHSHSRDPQCSSRSVRRRLSRGPAWHREPGDRSPKQVPPPELAWARAGARAAGTEVGDAAARFHAPGGWRWAGRVRGLLTHNNPTRWAISQKKQQRCLERGRG